MLLSSVWFEKLQGFCHHNESRPLQDQAMNPKSSSKTTRLISVSRTFDTKIASANLSVQRASTILFDNVAAAHAMGPRTAVGEKNASSYATVGTTTTFALMEAVAQLEGNGPGFRAALMPSGLAAITTLLMGLLKPGDHILVSDSVYGPMRMFCDTMLVKWGVSTTWIAPNCGAEIEAQIRPETKLIYLESPGSYTFELQDIPAICAIAKRHGVFTAIDNAWASPLYANPFEWGVDFSLVPLTKHWGGHADVLMGAIICSDANWPLIWPSIRQLGQCVSSDDAWLILRGIRTVDVRMRQCSENTQVVIDWLKTRPEVNSVLWPALPEHPQHAIWQRDYLGAAALFSFELKPGTTTQQVHALCDHLEHFGIGYSWGGFESLIMPANLGGGRTLTPWTGGPLVRVNIGLESPDDLIADLATGFKRMVI